MGLTRSVQGEKGRVVTITAYKDGTTEFQYLTGATITGIIESIPGPEYTVREISGTLAVVAAPNDYQINWTWDETDTGTDGDFSVQFIASVGGSIIYKSFPEPWKVVRSPTTPTP